jgi:hypothetical protein
MERLNSVKFSDVAKNESIPGAENIPEQSGREAGEIPSGDPS